MAVTKESTKHSLKSHKLKKGLNLVLVQDRNYHLSIPLLWNPEVLLFL